MLQIKLDHQKITRKLFQCQPMRGFDIGVAKLLSFATLTKWANRSSRSHFVLHGTANSLWQSCKTLWSEGSQFDLAHCRKTSRLTCSWFQDMSSSLFLSSVLIDLEIEGSETAVSAFRIDSQMRLWCFSSWSATAGEEWDAPAKANGMLLVNMIWLQDLALASSTSKQT